MSALKTASFVDEDVVARWLRPPAFAARRQAAIIVTYLYLFKLD